MLGIAVAGTTLVDKIYGIGAYPKVGELASITEYAQSVGGCVPNVAIDLKKIRPDIPVRAYGKVGRDAEGEYVKARLNEENIDIQGIKSSETGTSFTLVMSVEGGERTFFTYAGANAEFGADDIDLSSSDLKMLHLGYFMLLDKMDSCDGIKVLSEAKRRGISTSIDLVSRDNVSYEGVIPLLKYVDNLIINEIEASRLCGVDKDSDIREMAERLLRAGVNERVIIHKPEVAVCASTRGTVCVPSFDLPTGFVKGSTGAGDAFCAGALISIYEESRDKEILEFASSVAVASLRCSDAVGGLCEVSEINRICKDLKRRALC